MRLTILVAAMAAPLALAGCAPGAQPVWNASAADIARCRYEARIATAGIPNAFIQAAERRQLEDACLEAVHASNTEAAGARLATPAALEWRRQVDEAADALADGVRCGLTPDQNGAAMLARSAQLRGSAPAAGVPAGDAERLVNDMPIQAAQMVRDGRPRPTPQRCSTVRPMLLQWASASVSSGTSASLAARGGWLAEARATYTTLSDAPGCAMPEAQVLRARATAETRLRRQALALGLTQSQIDRDLYETATQSRPSAEATPTRCATVRERVRGWADGSGA